MKLEIGLIEILFSCECNVFFDKSSKKRRNFQDLLGGISQQSNEVRAGKRKSDFNYDARKRLKTFSGEDSMRSFKNVRWTAEYTPLKDAVGVEALLLTQKSLNKNRDNMMETIGRLQERLDSIISNRDPDREVEPLRLQEELTSLKTCLEVCIKASNLLSNQELNIGGDVTADRDQDQIVVTALADLFHVTAAGSVLSLE